MTFTLPLLVQMIRSDALVSIEASRGELARAFAALGFNKGAEIGVWKGVYSETLCKANPALQLLCVDPWRPQPDYLEQKNDEAVLERAYQEAQTRLAPYQCTILRTTSLEAAADVEKDSLDFVYIDGNHRYDAVAQDLARWAPKVRRGGIVAGHDFLTKTKRHIDVERAVVDYTTARGVMPLFVLRSKEDETPSWFWVQR